jgi:hypothetical protein
MLSVRQKMHARRLLQETSATPRMFATTREALVMRVATVLEVCLDRFDVRAFYAKHLEPHGSLYLGIDKPLVDDWGRGVITDGLEMLR